MKVQYPNILTQLNSDVKSPYTQFTMYPFEDTVIMYIGSTNGANGTLTLAWENMYRDNTIIKPNGKALYSMHGIAMNGLLIIASAIAILGF